MTGDQELVRALVEERALRRLTEDYARGADRREPAAVASLFTENGVLTLLMNGPEEEATGRHRGRLINIALAVRYLDRCVRSDGRWLFSERTMITDWIDRSEHKSARS
jgi:hypothetical protein